MKQFLLGTLAIALIATLNYSAVKAVGDCAGSLTHRLEVGDQGRIAQRFSTLRQQPAGKPIKVVFSPAYFVVLQGPVCDGYGPLTWYEIQYEDGSRGWASESQIYSIWGQNQYWLEEAPLADIDNDALQDRWETHGITIDPDGTGPLPPQFVDLPAMGADPNIPDIFVHMDWMADATHSHALQQQAIDLIVASFGAQGIQFHVDQGANSTLDITTGATWGTLSRARALNHVTPLGSTVGGNYDWTDFQTIKDAPGGFTESGRTPIFHYAISAHNYGSTTSSGISRGITASDFIVSLGSFTSSTGTVEEQAGTLMHELGHNLSLRHGGSDHSNYKPNFLSVMNYFFQLGGVIRGGAFGTFDYSGEALADLNEATLTESVGLGAGSAGFGTVFFCAGTFNSTFVADASVGIDWNCDGDATDTGLSTDVNDSGSTETLTSYDDWANIVYMGGAIGQAGVTPPLPLITPDDEFLTPELAERIDPGDDENPIG